jgi:hypothetical protein
VGHENKTTYLTKEEFMTTENQTHQLEKKTLLKSHRATEKKSTMKSLSLKPTRSLKKSSGLKPNPLKLK